MQELKRELGVFGAVMMGLGSIIGTGIFVSIGIAAGITGPAVLLATAVASGVAVCNALSSAQLAANTPVSGGTYEYGYRYLHHSLGFTAGWMFLCAKSASAATAALGFAGYLLYALDAPQGYRVPLAVAATAVLTMLVAGGIRRSSFANTVIVSLTLLGLTVFVLLGLPHAAEHAARNVTPFFSSNGSAALAGFFHATALMFVAYTGYGRIATMGEEVREPERTIPRAIVLTLVFSAVLYILVTAVAIAVVGADGLAAAAASSAAPLEFVAAQYDAAAAKWIVLFAAMLAMLGVLLNLLLGLSRVLLAMSRRGDMPRSLAAIHGPEASPRAAVLSIGLLIAVLACLGSVNITWSFSAFTVLVYYAITNLAALRLSEEARLYPRGVSYAGLVACVFLAFWVEQEIWLAGLLIVLFGLVWHFLRRQFDSLGETGNDTAHK